MGGPFVRGDPGDSGPARHAYTLVATTTGIEDIPIQCRYFKSDVATTMIVRLRLDAASQPIPVMPGVNIEDVGWVYNPSAISGALIVFFG